MTHLPVVKDRQLIKVLRVLGFTEHRQRGTSHLIMVHPDGRRAVIAMHAGKDIPRGTLRSILRDIEVLPEEFEKLLRK